MLVPVSALVSKHSCSERTRRSQAPISICSVTKQTAGWALIGAAERRLPLNRPPEAAAGGPEPAATRLPYFHSQRLNRALPSAATSHS
jgi:hypothetical protein